LLSSDHLKFFKMVAGRHLGFDPTGNGAVRSAVPENRTLEPNMKGIGRRVAELWSFEIFQTLTAHRTSDTQVIVCPVLLCSALENFGAEK